MRKLFGLLACLSLTVAFAGCENPQQKKIDKAASEDKAAINEAEKMDDKEIGYEAKEEKAEVNAAAKDLKADVDAEAKEEKEAAE